LCAITETNFRMKLKSHFFLLLFLVTNTFAQSWKKQSNKNMADSVYAVYFWESCF
jgi:hypothetical protein